MSFFQFDSFDGYDTANIGSRWSTSGGTIVTSGRNGSKGLQCGSGDNPKNTLTTTYNTFTVGWAYRTSDYSGKPIKVSNHTTGLTVTVDHVGDGTLTVTPSIGSTSAATATIDALAKGTFYFIELQVSASVTAGTMTLGYALYLDDTNVITGSASAAWAFANGFDTYGLVGPSSGTCIIDDLYVTDTELLGNFRAQAFFPTGDGTTTAYTPSTGSTHYTLVNETTPNDDTNYVIGINNADVELFTFPGLTETTAPVIVGLQNVIRARKPSGALAAIKPFYKSGSATATGALIQSTTSYSTYLDTYRKSVFTGVDWGHTEITNMQVGSTVLANGYAFKRSFTIDHTKIGSADITNYTVLISGTYSWMATAAHGGELLDLTNGYDFNFYSDANGTVALNYETVSHDLTTGTVEIHVQVPSVSHTADTTFYCFYAWAGGTTNLSTGATWDSNYVAVHHFQTPSGSVPAVIDSTSNSINFTDGLPVTAGGTAGVVGASGLSLGGSTWVHNNTTMSHPSYSFPNGSSPRTFECWVKSHSGASGEDFYGYGSGVGAGNRFALGTNGGKWSIETRGYTLTFGTIDSSWHHLVAVFPSGATQVSQTLCYLDGVLQTPTVVTDGNLNTAGPSYIIGAIPDSFIFGTPAGIFTGSVDECRWSKTDRSASYALACYNNQSDPASFYSVGSQSGAPQVPTRITQQYLEIAIGNGGLGEGSLYTAH